jgi:serine/threonine protein kinase
LSFIRWWRAPEVNHKSALYDERLDIWSVGCIMAQLILLQPIFRGSDRVNQLEKIFDIIGTPDLAILNEICTPGL